ncbi:phage integrase SAM-like domain-containing protein [Adhaeribacter aquaticus]|uniref:phage integrase SAM-like domain-containing protein n=1 Tax=Adhaeribacter aquaticus TaxID=299567 RepID=UPI000410B017|nr:phage integrase SAM-like domain-containing protein [Adhaeribacter aquaticus]
MGTSIKVTLKPEPAKNGKHAIRIRFSSDRKSTYANTGIFIAPECFNEAGYLLIKKKPVADVWVINHISAELYNERLKEDMFWLDTVKTTYPHFDRNQLKAAYEKYLINRDAEGNILEIDLEGKEPEPELPAYATDFIAYLEEHLTQINVPNTHRAYLESVRKLQRYLAPQTKLPFEQLTYKFLRDYKAHLESLGNADTTIQLSYAFFKKIANQAVKDGLIPANPFNEIQFRAKRRKTKKIRPSSEQINIIKSYRETEIKGAYLDALNIFFTQYYLHGARVGDVIELKWTNVTPERIEYITRKNKRFKSIKRTEFVNNMLEYYGTPERKQDIYIFPYLRDKDLLLPEKLLVQKINSKATTIRGKLRTLATQNELGIKLSTHMSRHSFADAVRKLTGDVYKLKELLGHSDIATTALYVEDLSLEELDETSDQVYKN